MAIRVYLHYHRIDTGENIQGFVNKDGTVGIIGNRNFQSVEKAKNYIARHVQHISRWMVTRARIMDGAWVVFDNTYRLWTHQDLTRRFGDDTEKFIHFVCGKPRSQYEDIETLTEKFRAYQQEQILLRKKFDETKYSFGKSNQDN